MPRNVTRPIFMRNGIMPTVTQVLEPFTDFSAVPPEVLEYAAERGTRVHGYCAAIASGLWIPGGIDDECAGYVASFRRWFSFVDEVHAVELRLHDDTMGFSGQSDLIVTLNGDKALSLWDLKSPITEGRTWCAQVAAYRHLATEHGFRIARQGSIRLKRDGCAPIVKEYSGSYDRDFAAFIAALTAWKYFKKED